MDFIERMNFYEGVMTLNELKLNERAALLIIVKHYFGKLDGVWNNTPQALLIEEFGINRRNTYALLKKLEDKGVISIHQNVYESADDIVPNIEYINNLINVSKMTPNTYGSKTTPNTYGSKTTHKLNYNKLNKEISYYNYNYSTRKKNENLDKVNEIIVNSNSITSTRNQVKENEINNTVNENIVNMNLDKGLFNENEIIDSSNERSLTKTELNVIEDKGTLVLMEGNNNEKGTHSPYSGSTNPAQGKYNPLGLIPTRTEDNGNWDFDTLFNGPEGNANDHNPYETQIQAAGEPISIVVGQLPTAAEKHAQNANKVAIRQSKATTDNLTSDDIRTITVQTLREDYNRSKNVLWNGAKFKHLAIAAVEQSNHLLYENGTRLAMVACGTYLHGKVTYLNSKDALTENQRTRLKLALRELGSNIKQYGCADTLKTLQYGCADFDYTLQYFRV